MKVILISKVVNYGNIGDVVEAKNGYARNFLIPNNKAIHYSVANYKSFEDKKKEFEAKNKEASNAANEIKKVINGQDIVIIENASDDGRLYGAVSSSILVKKINEVSKGLAISKSDITLEKPIKETGVYSIEVSLHSDVNAQLRVIVARSESEIKSVIKQDQEKQARNKKEREEEVTVKEKKVVNKEELSQEEVTQVADQQLEAAVS